MIEDVLQSHLLCSLFNQQISDHNITQVIVKDLYCLYISSDILFVVHFNNTSPCAVFKNIIAVVSLDGITNHFAAVTADGHLLLMVFDGEFHMKEVWATQLRSILVFNGEIESPITLHFDSHCNALTIHCQCTGLIVVFIDSTNIISFVILHTQVLVCDSLPVLFAFWGQMDEVGEGRLLVTCGLGTTLYHWGISSQFHKDFNSDVDKTASTSQVSSLVTKHRGWVTALSMSVTPCDLGASGDCLGTVCLWRITSSPTRDIQLLLVDRTATSGHSIGSILVDALAGLLWVADSSGCVSCMMFNLRGPRPTLEINTKVSVFHGPSSASPSILQWRSFAANKDVAGEDGSRCSGSLRCFCQHSGRLVECSVPRNAVNVFRVWPEYPRFKEHASLAECCEVASSMNCVLTAGAGRYLYVYEMNSGRLVHTILLEDSLCSSLAVHESFEMSVSSTTCTALVATGHSNGAVSIFRLTASIAGRRGSEHDSLGRHPNQQVEHLEPSMGSSTESVSGVALFDIIGADSEVLVSRLPLAASKSHRESQDMQQSVSQELIGPMSIDGMGEDRHQQQYQLQQQQEPVYSHKVIFSSRIFSPLPVTDLFVSNLGGHLIVCYLRKFVTVYSLVLERVVRSLSLEEGVLCITVVASTEEPSVGQQLDSLILAVQTARKVFLLDAVQGAVLTEFDLLTGKREVACSGLWDQPLNNRSGDRSIAGICVTKDFSVFLFGDLSGFVQHPLVLTGAALPQTNPVGNNKLRGKKRMSHKQHPGTSHSASQLDGLVQWMHVYAAGHSPLAAVWSLRHVVIMRVTLDNYRPEVMRSMQLCVGDDRVRVVRVVALKTLPNMRAHRALVVLSDGTAYVVHI